MGFKDIVSKFGATSRPFDEGTEHFLTIDIGIIVRHLDLVKLATAQGRKNQPPADSTQTDSIAQKINLYFIELARQGRDSLTNHIAAMFGPDSYQSDQKTLTELKTQTYDGSTNLYQTCREGVNTLFPIRKDLADSERDFGLFREKNKLERPAEYPKSTKYSWWLLVLLIIIEAVVNAYMLGMVDPAGPIGALVPTVLIAFINVMAGFMAGWWCIRQAYHVNAFRKMIGVVGAILLFAFTLIFNFGVGHYRNQLLTLKENTTSETEERAFIDKYNELLSQSINYALSSPAELEIISALLIFVGIGMGIFASIKGFSMDDKYPGYGARDRARKLRQSEYESEFEDLQHALSEQLDQANKDINGIISLNSHARGLNNDHLQLLNILNSKFSNWITMIESAGKSCYAQYREINEQFRTDANPETFTNNFTIPEQLKTPLTYSNASEGEIVHDLDQLCRQSLEQISGCHSEYLRVYETIGALAPKELASSESMLAFDNRVEEINRKTNNKLEELGLGSD